MNKKNITLQICVILLTVTMTTILSFAKAQKLPAEKAGTIGKPIGQIAFNRDKNIWVMDPDGSNQDMIVEATNATGRISWSPSGRHFVFTRSGQASLIGGPDPNVGGYHKVNDLFIGHLDSAYANNRSYWTRLTFDLGSQSPEWSADGKTIIFEKDMNSNYVNTFLPNFQICTIDSGGNVTDVLRKDWRNFGSEFVRSPSINANGDIAGVAFHDMKWQGLVIINKDNFMEPMDSIKARAAKNRNLIRPAWSPDSKWLAYINNSISDGGLYIATPDLSQKYLVFSPPVGRSLNTSAPASWSPDSKWLTVSTSDGSIWIVDITGNGLRQLTGPGLDSNPAWSKGPKK